MNTHCLQLAAGLLVLFIFTASSAVRYVDLNSANPLPPYTDWITAATNIQDAVDAADSGDQILVTNGVYYTGGRVVSGILSNRVAVAKTVNVQSVNGPAVTLIQGKYRPFPVRCVYLSGGATLMGFTLTNGGTGFSGNEVNDQSGGGVWCESSGEIVSNCVLISNNAAYFGGGAYGGTLNNCVLMVNSAQFGGGGCFSTMNCCTLTSNSANISFQGIGGGSYISTLSNCTLTGNWAFDFGGGSYGGTLNNCKLRNNSAQIGGGSNYGLLNNCNLTGNSASYEGGGCYGAGLNECTVTGNSAGRGGGCSSSTLNNCMLSWNLAGTGGGSWKSSMNNCTLTGNSASSVGGGDWGGMLMNCTIAENSANRGGGSFSSTLDNCVVWDNHANSNLNYAFGQLRYSCTIPLASGTGNITNEPLFIDRASGNLRLQSNSPCINAGKNAYAPVGPDLDGNARIAGGTVDIGAYEFQNPSSMLSYVWAQRYGLPTSGLADYADSDGDGMNNWQEWRADTIPTNNLSLLEMLFPSGTVSAVVVTWRSVSGVNYFLDRSSNLGTQPSFLTLKTNISGQSGTTTYIDTNAVGTGQFFYRVGVQE